MSLWLTCQRLLVFFLGETRNGFEMLEGGSGIMWRYVTALPALHRSRSDLISISVKLLTIHTFTRTHTIYWLCLYKHAMRLHLRCVERHIKRGWFPQTDTPTLWQALTLLTGFMKTTSISNCCVWWRDKRSVQRVFSWLIVSLCLPVIIKMTQPPRLIPVTVVALQSEQQSCYCLSFGWKDRVGQRAEGFCSERWKIWCPAWANFSSAPWEMSYLSSACKKPWH